MLPSLDVTLKISNFCDWGCFLHFMASKNNLINSEVKAVLASMRLNTKFSSKPNVQLPSNKAQNLVTNLKKLQALLTKGIMRKPDRSNKTN